MASARRQSSGHDQPEVIATPMCYAHWLMLFTRFHNVQNSTVTLTTGKHISTKSTSTQMMPFGNSVALNIGKTCQAIPPNIQLILVNHHFIMFIMIFSGFSSINSSGGPMLHPGGRWRRAARKATPEEEILLKKSQMLVRWWFYGCLMVLMLNGLWLLMSMIFGYCFRCVRFLFRAKMAGYGKSGFK